MRSTANRTVQSRPNDLDQFATSKILNALSQPCFLVDGIEVCVERENVKRLVGDHPSLLIQNFDKTRTRSFHCTEAKVLRYLGKSQTSSTHKVQDNRGDHTWGSNPTSSEREGFARKGH